jgi:hypothetical protein
LSSRRNGSGKEKPKVEIIPYEVVESSRNSPIPLCAVAPVSFTIIKATFSLKVLDYRSDCVSSTGFDGNELFAKPGIELIPVDGKPMQQSGCQDRRL